MYSYRDDKTGAILKDQLKSFTIARRRGDDRQSLALNWTEQTSGSRSRHPLTDRSTVRRRTRERRPQKAQRLHHQRERAKGDPDRQRDVVVVVAVAVGTIPALAPVPVPAKVAGPAVKKHQRCKDALSISIYTVTSDGSAAWMPPFEEGQKQSRTASFLRQQREYWYH